MTEFETITAGQPVESHLRAFRPPFVVKSACGYGKTAWQVLDAQGYVVGRLRIKGNAEAIALLLNAGHAALSNHLETQCD